MTIHNYHFGSTKGYRDNYDSIFRKDDDMAIIHTEADAEIKELQKRYEALERLYLRHIHEHRMGLTPAEECDMCRELMNKAIEKELEYEQDTGLDIHFTLHSSSDIE